MELISPAFILKVWHSISTKYFSPLGPDFLFKRTEHSLHSYFLHYFIYLKIILFYYHTTSIPKVKQNSISLNVSLKIKDVLFLNDLNF